MNNGRSNINSRPSLTPLELPTSRKNSGGSAYQLMGQNHIPGHDETSIALRKQLDKEYQEKKALESKVSWHLQNINKTLLKVGVLLLLLGRCSTGSRYRIESG